MLIVWDIIKKISSTYKNWNDQCFHLFKAKWWKVFLKSIETSCEMWNKIWEICMYAILYCNKIIYITFSEKKTASEEKMLK